MGLPEARGQAQAPTPGRFAAAMAGGVALVEAPACLGLASPKAFSCDWPYEMVPSSSSKALI